MDFFSLTVAELEAQVRYHNHLYWDRNEPELSDTDYDRLVRALKEKAPESKVLLEMGPTPERAGADVVKHSAPMLSLDKCYGDEELLDWAKHFEGDVSISPKFDGIAASLRYTAHGHLEVAATRGNGKEGEDITANVRHIQGIPKKIPAGSHGALEVRGEIFMKLSVFERFREKFSNPRNLTAGAVKLKDTKRTAEYQLSFGVYELIGTQSATEKEKLALLAELGFECFEALIATQERMLDSYRQLAQRRPDLDFEIDGIVIKADQVNEQQRLGVTSHHPRYAIAYKFQGDTGTTQVRDIEWSVARTGAITPVAIVDPVMLSGAMVGRASLHHPGYLQKLGLSQDAEVEVTRRGGVIPHVERVTKAGGEPFTPPEACPACDSPVEPDGDFLFCTNPSECRAAVVGQLAHFVSVVGMEGFGERILRELYERRIARSPAALYTLELEKLLPIERVGKKLAQNLIDQANAYRKLPLGTFLRALGISELGKHVSAILEDRYETLERVLDLKAEELERIHSIGERIAQSVTQGLVEQRPLIDALLEHVTILPPEPKPDTADLPFAETAYVFTGKMAKMDRKTAQKLAKKLGAATPSSVTKAVTHLVVGDDKGSGKKSTKEKAADKLIAAGAELNIISESDFLESLPEEERAALLDK